MTCKCPQSEMSLQLVCSICSFFSLGRGGCFSVLNSLYTLYLQHKCWVQTPAAAKWHLDLLSFFTIFQTAAIKMKALELKFVRVIFL